MDSDIYRRDQADREIHGSVKLNIKQYIEKSVSYEEYIELVKDLLEQGRATGDVQNESRLEYTRLNLVRMNRVAKTLVHDELSFKAAVKIELPQTWLIITEGWCGDAAQNLAAVEHIASANDRIKTRYILRDENPELMNEFLTNGSRSIPKLIAVDDATGRVLGTWGARPAAAQQYWKEMNEQGIEKDQLSENLQRWYNADKGVSLQQELAMLATDWSQGELVARV